MASRTLGALSISGLYQRIMETRAASGHLSSMRIRSFHHMNSRRLGKSDMFITPVGFGSWAIGGAGWQFGWGKQDDEASVAAIHRALELGVNWIDTAAVYGLGHS